jgi:hypothetical protein
VAKQLNFYIGRKNSYLVFNDTLLNRNDEKWPHTRQIKIAGRTSTLQQTRGAFGLINFA